MYAIDTRFIACNLLIQQSILMFYWLQCIRITRLVEIGEIETGLKSILVCFLKARMGSNHEKI